MCLWIQKKREKEKWALPCSWAARGEICVPYNSGISARWKRVTLLKSFLLGACEEEEEGFDGTDVHRLPAQNPLPRCTGIKCLMKQVNMGKRVAHNTGQHVCPAFAPIRQRCHRLALPPHTLISVPLISLSRN